MNKSLSQRCRLWLLLQFQSPQKYSQGSVLVFYKMIVFPLSRNSTSFTKRRSKQLLETGAQSSITNIHCAGIFTFALHFTLLLRRKCFKECDKHRVKNKQIGDVCLASRHSNTRTQTVNISLAAINCFLHIASLPALAFSGNDDAISSVTQQLVLKQ